jgi:hypothetical protein
VTSGARHSRSRRGKAMGRVRGAGLTRGNSAPISPASPTRCASSSAPIPSRRPASDTSPSGTVTWTRPPSRATRTPPSRAPSRNLPPSSPRISLPGVRARKPALLLRLRTRRPHLRPPARARRG